jgi:hypothetical protein
MIDKLYGKYFQKSRSFLYPALGIKKSSAFNPTGTYICIDGMIEADEMKLVCAFKKDESAKFKDFEEQMLLSNPLFLEKIDVENTSLYIFSMEIYKADWFCFLLGKYSKLSSVLKKAIKAYYGDKSAEYKFIDTYLFPEKYFEIYAELLELDVKTLKQTGELCDPCDIEKETLKIPVKDLELLKTS